MSNSNSEREPLLQEQQLVNDGDEEASPNYPATSKNRVLRDVLVVFISVISITILIIYLAVQKPTRDSSLLDDIRKLYNTPSLAAGALRNGTFDLQVSGVRKFDDPTLVEADDLWHLGSNTKAITATILALLIEDGLLSWDTTISEALPAWSGRMLDGHRNTTLAMIGAHRGALSDEWATLSGGLFSRLYDYSSIEGRGLVAEYALTHPPVFEPGTQFLYSNTGFTMMGYIMEQVTGQSWEDLIKSRIFDPLGMDRCIVGSRDTSLPPTNPWPHLLINSSDIVPLAPDIYGDNPIAIAPAGLVSCPLTSYSKFLTFHLNGYKGRLNANLTLSDVSFKMLHDPWPGTIYSSGGWGAVDVKGVGHILVHTGSNGLNFFKAMIVPDMEGAFIAATNIGLAENATEQVLNALIDGRLLS